MFELKQKEISVDKANLAAVFAGMLQSLLTHKKVQLTKEGSDSGCCPLAEQLDPALNFLHVKVTNITRKDPSIVTSK